MLMVVIATLKIENMFKNVLYLIKIESILFQQSKDPMDYELCDINVISNIHNIEYHHQVYSIVLWPMGIGKVVMG